MPVAKKAFSSADILEEAISADLGLKFNKKKTIVEREKESKIIRCFKCKKFGHITKNCLAEPKCENCGKEGNR